MQTYEHLTKQHGTIKQNPYVLKDKNVIKGRLVYKELYQIIVSEGRKVPYS